MYTVTSAPRKKCTGIINPFLIIIKLYALPKISACIVCQKTEEGVTCSLFLILILILTTTCTHVGFKSNKSMDFDFIKPDCSYSRIIPAKQKKINPVVEEKKQS